MNQGNMIISTCSDQTAEELIKFQDSFNHILTNIRSEQAAILHEDKRWFKIQIDGVNTRSLSIGNGHILHSAEAVHTELLTCNPLYNKS